MGVFDVRFKFLGHTGDFRFTGFLGRVFRFAEQPQDGGQSFASLRQSLDASIDSIRRFGTPSFAIVQRSDRPGQFLMIFGQVIDLAAGSGR